MVETLGPGLSLYGYRFDGTTAAVSFPGFRPSLVARVGIAIGNESEDTLPISWIALVTSLTSGEVVTRFADVLVMLCYHGAT